MEGYVNVRHFERMKVLVDEGLELRRVLNFFNASPITPDGMLIKGGVFEKYHEISQELHALPEELAKKWSHAKQKLIENKIYPYIPQGEKK